MNREELAAIIDELCEKAQLVERTAIILWLWATVPTEHVPVLLPLADGIKRGDHRTDAASADTHPKDGDVLAAPLVSGAARSEAKGDAQP